MTSLHAAGSSDWPLSQGISPSTVTVGPASSTDGALDVVDRVGQARAHAVVEGEPKHCLHAAGAQLVEDLLHVGDGLVRNVGLGVVAEVEVQLRHRGTLAPLLDRVVDVCRRVGGQLRVPRGGEILRVERDLVSEAPVLAGERLVRDGCPVKTVLAGTSQVSCSAAPAGASVRPVSSAALTVIGAMNFRVRL